MTALVGLFGAPARGDGGGRAHAMLGGMARRGGTRAAVWGDADAALGVARHDWEAGAAFAGDALVVRDQDCVVVADATLYYRAELRARLAAAGHPPRGDTASHLILAAYRAWGAACAEPLEGDFAFVVWDRRARRVVCARDPVGTRPLFYVDGGDGLAVASAAGALRAHPACGGALDLAAIAVDAAGLVFALSDATCWRNVRELDAAATLVRSLDGRTSVAPHWRPPEARDLPRTSVRDGAVELRDVLTAAVAERLDPAAPTCVWMSGGRDSTALFGAANDARRRGRTDHTPFAVSARLRDDDPGCENAVIAAAARHWGQEPRWIDLDPLPLLAPATGAPPRDEPYAIEYESFLRALVGATRDARARVALNGHGGDLLFGNSSVVLAAHLARGRLRPLWRECRARRHAGVRHLVKWGVEPLLPPAALRLVAALRGGRRLRGHYEATLPSWIDRRFARAHDLEARAAEATLHGARGDPSLHEVRWLLGRRHFPRVMRTLGGYGLDGGVEARSPLMDRRVVAFALSRPAEERSCERDTKRLLRQAMAGLLPAAVLAPRARRTGTFRGYFLSHFPALVPLLRHCARAPLLADLGIVDAAELRRLADRCATRSPGVEDGPNLLATLLVELWLRETTGVPVVGVPVVGAPASRLAPPARRAAPHAGVGTPIVAGPYPLAAGMAAVAPGDLPALTRRDACTKNPGLNGTERSAS